MWISLLTSFFSGRSNKKDQIHEGDNPIERLTNYWYKIPFIPEQNRSHTLYRLLFRLNSNFMFCISLTVLAKNYNSLKQDSLCLPRDPALTTRGLLEEGEYSPRDLLILDKQVAIIFRDICHVIIWLLPPAYSWPARGNNPLDIMSLSIVAIILPMSSCGTLIDRGYSGFAMSFCILGCSCYLVRSSWSLILWNYHVQLFLDFCLSS